MYKILRRLLIVSVCFCLVNTILAAIRDKANNSDNLNSGSSWVGGSVPGTADTAQWSSTVTGDNAALLGADLSWRGISVLGPGGNIYIGGDNSLTLDYLGVDMSSATADLSFTNATLVLKDYSCPIFNVASGQDLDLSPSSLKRGTHSTLSLRGDGTFSTTTVVNDSTGMIGPWLRIGIGTSTKYATVSGGIVGYTGTAAASAADIVDTTGTTNYETAVTGTLGSGADFNTLRYTGSSGNISGDFSANGLLSAGTGYINFYGALTIGDDQELILTSPDTTRQITLSGSVLDNAGGSSDVVITGGGQVNLNASNDYSGLTIVSAGSLVVGDDHALGSTNEPTVVYETGSYTTGGRLVLDGASIEEPIVLAGKGDGSPWQQGLSCSWSSGTNALKGPVTVQTSGGIRMTAGGYNSVLNIDAPVTRISGSGTFLIGAGGTDGRVNINAPLDNNGGSMALHNGPGTVAFNVSGHDIGDLAVQYRHMLLLGVDNALPYNRYLRVGSASGSTTPEMGSVEMDGYDLTVNGLMGSGNNTDASERVVKNTNAQLSTLTVGANNGGTTFDGIITENIALRKIGTGTQVLSGTRPNTYTGGTAVDGGRLHLGKSDGTNAIPGSITIGAGYLRNEQNNQIADTATVTMTNETARWELYGYSETVANLDMQNADPTVNEGYVSGAAGKLTVTDTFTHTQGNVTLNSNWSGGESVITANTLVNMGGDWTFGVNAGTQNVKVGSGGLTIGGGSEINVNANATCRNYISLSGDVTSLANASANEISGAGRVLLNGTIDFNVADGDADVDMEVSAIITNGAPSGTLTKSGPGVLFLSGANTYTGGTTVAAGALAIEDTAALPGWDTAAEYSVASGAALVLGNSITDGDISTILGTGNLAAGASMGFDTSDGDRTYTPDITDTGAGSLGVIKSGANMLTLTGANTYSGTTEVNAGELNIEDTAALPGWNTAGRYSVAGGAALIVQNPVTEANVTTMLDTGNFNAGATIGFDTSAGSRTHAAVISNSVNGSLSVLKVGTNYLYLTGDNSYDGTTTLDGGRMTIRHNNALGSTNGITIVNRVGGSGSYTDATGQLLLDGDGGDLVINENLRINGAEQYGYGGAMRNSRGNNTINGWIELGPNGGRIGISGGNLTLNGPIRPSEGVSPSLLVFNPSTGTITVNNTTDVGTRNALFHSGGTVLLNTNGNNWGMAQIQYGCKVKLGIDDAMPVDKTVLFGTTSGYNGTLNLNGFDQTVGGVRVDSFGGSHVNNYIRNDHATESGTFTVNHLSAVNETFSGRIIEAVNLVKDGVDGSVLTISGTNTFTGFTAVDGGSLVLANEWALQNSTYSDSTPDGTLVFDSAFTEFTFGGLAGSTGLALTNEAGVAIDLVVGNNNSDTIYSGALSEGGSLTKIGTGTLTLTGENTFSGTTTVTNGTLALGCDNALASGSQVILSGGTLASGAFANSLGVLSVSADSTIDLGDGSGSLAFADSSAQTWTGSLDITGNWAPYTLRVGTDASGLTEDQLKSITMDGDSVWVQIDEDGYLWQMNGTVIIVR